MELTPDLLLEAKFSSARRGYDMHEVDDFLERCAEGLDVLLARLRAEFDRAEAAEQAAKAGTSTGAPDQAQSTLAQSTQAPSTQAPSTEGAEHDTAAARPPDQDADVDADDQSSVDEPLRILLAAERTAEAAIAEAKTEAERIRREAEEVAGTTRREAEALLARGRAEAEAAARRAGAEARRAMDEQLGALRSDRDSLESDVRTLQRWLEDQRRRLKTAARDLQRVVDDPAALKTLPAPELVSAGASGTPEVTDEVAKDVSDPAGGDDGLEIFDDATVPDEPGAVDAPDHPVGSGDEGDGDPTQSVPVVGVNGAPATEEG